MPKSAAASLIPRTMAAWTSAYGQADIAHGGGRVPEKLGVANALASGVLQILIGEPAKVVRLQQKMAFQRPQNTQHTDRLAITPVKPCNVLARQRRPVFVDQSLECLLADRTEKMTVQLHLGQAQERMLCAVP